jgi:cytochrome c biogenesis protein CcmG/thiol:disulfide interchange protein DsbE
MVFSGALVVIIALLGLMEFTLQQRAAPPLAAGGAPAFELKTFDGQVLRLADLRGKPVIVNFWASWCAECKEEAALLEATWRQYRGQGLVMIGVDYVDTEAEALSYLKQFDITYPNGPDLGTRISQAYHITGVPETYFVGKDGRLLAGIDASGHPYANWIGPLTSDALAARIEHLLAQ